MILQHLLVFNGPIVNPIISEQVFRSRVGEAPYTVGLDPAILRVCSRSYEDGWPLLYRKNHFRFLGKARAHAWFNSNCWYKYRREVQHLSFVLKGDILWLAEIFQPPFRGFQRLQTVLLDVRRASREHYEAALELGGWIKHCIDTKQGRVHRVGVVVQIQGPLSG